MWRGEWKREEEEREGKEDLESEADFNVGLLVADHVDCTISAEGRGIRRREGLR